MALTPSITTAAQNAAADAVVDLVDVGGAGSLRIYSGTMPTDANTALSGNTLLANLAMSATAFGSASSGVATAATITADSSADATGTATFFRILAGNGTTVVIQGSVGTSGCDLNLTTTSIVATQPVSVSSLTYTQQAS
jgi:hypothetical protein